MRLHGCALPCLPSSPAGVGRRIGLGAPSFPPVLSLRPTFPDVLAARAALAFLPRGSARSSALGSAAAVAWCLAAPHLGSSGHSGPCCSQHGMSRSIPSGPPVAGARRRPAGFGLGTHWLDVSSATACGSGGQAAGGHAPTGPPRRQRQRSGGRVGTRAPLRSPCCALR